MTNSKVSDFTFEDSRKEKFVERLRALIDRHKSARAAAREWGLSFSTVNNYLNRGTEPSFFAIQSIAAKEGISLDWLAYGSIESLGTHSSIVNEPHKTESNPAKDTWSMIFDSVSPDDQKLLLNFFLKEGVRGVVNALSPSEDISSELANLPKDEKERLLRLYKQVKKGSPEDGAEAEPKSLTTEQKKAG